MNKKLRTIFPVAILITAIALTTIVSAQSTQNFSFESFSAQYYLDRTVNKTATLKTVETLVALFPEYDQNHGILRALPLTYQGHTTSLQVESVADGQGSTRNYSTSKENDNLVIKIGDKNKYIHGRQTYVITYTMRNVALINNDHQEFYWDVNGDQWAQTFNKVAARVHIPKDLAAQLQSRQVCFAGGFGQTASDSCTITRQDKQTETTINVAANSTVGPHQTLTFATAFNKGTFVLGPEIIREKQLNQIKRYFSIALLVLPGLITLAIMLKRWRAFGNDPQGRGVVVPEYEPPKGLNVISSDFILTESVQSQSLTAGIIELAVNGYLSISEILEKRKFLPDSKDYQLEIKRDIDTADTELRIIARAMFAIPEVGAKIKISEIKKSTTRRQAMYNSHRKLNRNLSSKLFNKGYFVRNPNMVKRSYWLWSLIPLCTSVGLFFLVVNLSWLVAGGLSIGLLIAALIMIFLAFIMPARSELGVTTHDKLLGLKEYIKMAEADRLKFTQSPEGAEKIKAGSYDPTESNSRIKLFESLLPYAMMFGLEKQWGEQFEGIYSNPPDWYSGNFNNFNTGYLASSLSGFSSAGAVSFSAPSSSSSGGFSGGGAGGGGGGGGGGGW